MRRGLSTVLYGTPGSGKTYQALTFPRESTLVISFTPDDVTLHGSDIHRHQFDVNKWDKFYTDLRTKEHPYKHIFLDDFCLFSFNVVEYLKQVNELGFPKKQQKDNAIHETVRWIKNYIDLNDMGIDVIFTTWDMTFNSDVGMTSSPMQINWEVTNYLCGLCNNVWELYREDEMESDVRYIRTKGSKLLKGKTKIPHGKENPLDSIMPNPNVYEMITELKEAIYGPEVEKDAKS